MEILNKLIVKWKKIPLKQKVIIMGVIVLIIFLLFFNRDFFSRNKIEISGGIAGKNLTDNNGNQGIINTGKVEGDVTLYNGDEKEIEEFKIKILNSSYFPLDKAVFYSDKECIDNKKIYSEYDKHTKEYSFHIEIKKNRTEKISVKQKNYLCKNFFIKQSNQTIKPIRLKIDCNLEPDNNECLVQEE